MLKRQRPATPPPPSLGDPPSLLDGPIRPYSVSDTSQSRLKRQRVWPPPLDGALRGWMESEPPDPPRESDSEEDWTSDARDVLPSATSDRYKDANSLLHELHVLNQHRLLFTHSHQDRRTPYVHTRGEEKPTACTGTPPCHAQPALDRLASGGRCNAYGEPKRLVDEVQCVRQRYEDGNRSLGSLFLSRRREVERMASSTDLNRNS